MIDPLINLWDVAPLHTIVEEAGGRLTDWRGETSDDLAEALATNGLVHDEVLDLLRHG
jgi:histidinol-phosphatase